MTVKTLHCADHNELHSQLAKVITLDEVGHPKGTIVVRYTGLMSAALMCGYIFAGRCRYGLRVLSDAEAEAYRLSRGEAFCGEGI
jgi:hypothetical protein